MTEGESKPHRHSIWDQGIDSPPLLYLLLGLGILLFLLSPYLYPIVIALIFVMAGMKTRKILQSMSPRRKRTVLGSFYFVFVLFISLVMYCTGYISKNIDTYSKKNLLGELQGKTHVILDPVKNYMISTLDNWIPSHQLNHFVDDRLQNGIQRAGDFLTTFMFIAITSLPMILFNLTVCVIAIMVFQRKYHDLRFYTLVNVPTGNIQKTLKNIWDHMESSAYTTMVSTLTVSLIQGLIVCSGAYFSQLDAWPLYFLAGFFFSFVPVIGLLPVIVMGFIHCLALHGLPNAFIFLAFSALASIMDNILLSLFMAEKKKSLVNSLMNFFCLISALYIFGAPGIILGPFLVSLSQGLRRHAAEEMGAAEIETPVTKTPVLDKKARTKLRTLGYTE